MKPGTLSVERVSKRYGAGKAVVPALVDISFAVAASELVAVIGASGSGKSTLLNLVAALDLPSAGRIVLDGQDLTRLSENARSDVRLRRIGFVFQSYNLLPTFTIEENVAWPLELRGLGRGGARERAAAALARVGVPRAAWERRPAELSGGEQQRVAVARAVAADPRLLVADEPTGNLDSHAGNHILALLRACADAGTTVLLVTHNPTHAALADRTIELHDGRITHDVRNPRHVPTLPTLVRVPAREQAPEGGL